MTYSTPREFSNSRNSLKSLLRRMVQELKQQLQPFVAGQLFVKLAISECGVESIGEAHIQFRSQYYLYAIIFLIFDVEAVFLVPFAVAFTALPVGAFIAILIFLFLLVEGLVWAWGKGCLQWAR